MVKTAKTSVIKNLAAIKDMLDGIISKMIDGTVAPIEEEIAENITCDYFSDTGVIYAWAIDECRETYGSCPFSGVEDWPEDKNDQIMLLQGISESISNFISAPPKTSKPQVKTQVTMVIQPYYNNSSNSSFGDIPKDDPIWKNITPYNG